MGKVYAVDIEFPNKLTTEENTCVGGFPDLSKVSITRRN